MISGAYFDLKTILLHYDLPYAIDVPGDYTKIVGLVVTNENNRVVDCGKITMAKPYTGPVTTYRNASSLAC